MFGFGSKKVVYHFSANAHGVLKEGDKNGKCIEIDGSVCMEYAKSVSNKLLYSELKTQIKNQVKESVHNIGYKYQSHVVISINKL